MGGLCFREEKLAVEYLPRMIVVKGTLLKGEFRSGFIHLLLELWVTNRVDNIACNNTETRTIDLSMDAEAWHRWPLTRAS